MERTTAAQRLEQTAILAEPVRRSLYLHVARQPEAISRDQAAEAVGVDRSLAAFHLDKLVDAGLLEASFRRLTGRSGPGAGRPSKLYQRSARSVDVTIPERQYELLARLLAGAVGTSAAAAGALGTAARELGETIGTEARTAAGAHADRDRLLQSATEALDRMGFQPYLDAAGDIRLRNCPFDALARDHRDLVCTMNLAMMDGILEGLRAKGITASLEPTAGQCCVALRRRS